MARATLTKALFAVTKNETGLLGRITAALAVQNVYILHLSAYREGDQGYLQMITKDNEMAKKALAHFITRIEEKNVLIVEFENKVGTLSEVAKLLGNFDVGINQVYGTSADGFKIIGVFSTDDDAKAAQIINRETGSLGVSS